MQAAAYVPVPGSQLGPVDATQFFSAAALDMQSWPAWIYLMDAVAAPVAARAMIQAEHFDRRAPSP
eukprot:803337-Amphidinium_carterae.1